MKKALLITGLCLLLTALLAPSAAAQTNRRELKVMEYYVYQGDTIFMDELPPAVIHPRQTMSRRNWVKYYQRVHNFSKAYPYALFIARVINETDSLFAADHYTPRQQEKYLNQMKDGLLKAFKFDGKDQLFHIALYETETSQYMLFDVAHIMGDGITMNILLEDVNKRYAGEEIERETYTFYDYIVDDEKRRRPEEEH